MIFRKAEKIGKRSPSIINQFEKNLNKNKTKNISNFSIY